MLNLFFLEIYSLYSVFKSKNFSEVKYIWLYSFIYWLYVFHGLHFSSDKESINTAMFEWEYDKF